MFYRVDFSYKKWFKRKYSCTLLNAINIDDAKYQFGVYFPDCDIENITLINE